PLLAFHRLREGIETRADRVVDALRTDGDDEAPKQVGVDARPELDGAALPGAELLLERGDLLAAERVGGSDLGGHLAALGGGDGPERADRRGEFAGSPVLRQHAKEVAGQR